MSGHPDVERRIVPVQKEGTSLKEKLLKYEMGVLPIWFGSRFVTAMDLEVFQGCLVLGFGSHNLYGPMYVPEVDKTEETEENLHLMASDIEDLLPKISQPLAIFVVTTPRAAEYSWLNQFPKRLEHYCRQSRKFETFVYKVIMGGGIPFKKEGRRDPNNYFDRDEVRAQELGAAYLHYHPDAPTAGSRRLIEFFNRVLGDDLPGNKFPDYSSDELKTIAWYLSRENFNLISRRSGAIDKYPIINGKPLLKLPVDY